MAGKTTGSGGPEAAKIPAHVLIIEARFYEDIADELAAGAIGELEGRGATYERISVPGALEIPQVLTMALEAGRLDEDDAEQPMFDGVIALGCVIRGETFHFEIVCNNANHWLMEAATMSGVPLGNAILTVDTREQALERARGGRAGKGGDAARACLRLVEIRRAFGGSDD